MKMKQFTDKSPIGFPLASSTIESTRLLASEKVMKRSVVSLTWVALLAGTSTWACGSDSKTEPDCVEVLAPLTGDGGVGGAAGGPGHDALPFEGTFEAPVRWSDRIDLGEANVTVTIVRTGAGSRVTYSPEGSCAEPFERFPVDIDLSTDDGSYRESGSTTIDQSGNIAYAGFLVKASDIMGSLALSKEPGAITSFEVTVADGALSGLILVHTEEEGEGGDGDREGSAAGGVTVATF
jgi:hypothetical protein